MRLEGLHRASITESPSCGISVATQLPHNPRLKLLRFSERRLSWRITALPKTCFGRLVRRLLREKRAQVHVGNRDENEVGIALSDYEEFRAERIFTKTLCNLISATLGRNDTA